MGRTKLFFTFFRLVGHFMSPFTFLVKTGITLGETDFKPLRKFNGAKFYICFAFLSEEPKIIEKINLAKCPF